MGTSHLQRLTVKEIDQIFGCHAVQENFRPDWMIGPSGHRLEIDVFIPSAGIAIEVQGPQHFRFSQHFHGTAERFDDQVRRDSQKRLACARNGVTLHEVASESDLYALVGKLKGHTPRPDPKHMNAQQAEAESHRWKQIDWLTRVERGKLQDAVAHLSRVARETPPDALLHYETARSLLKAESFVEKRRNQLARAQVRAMNGERLGIKKRHQPKGSAS